MATVGQIYYNVLDTNSGDYISSSGIDIFSDIVSAYGATQFSKIGIQAPPGTKVVMNETKTIMIGRTGMYELDNNINIIDMYFIRPKKYIYDEITSSMLIEQGTAEMQQADRDRTAAMTELNMSYPDGIPNQEDDPEGYKAYWAAYNNIQLVYITSYQAGLDKYNKGINGVYILPNPNDITAEENYQDLLNVIVDFIYE